MIGILYFSSTGNSLYIAKKVKEKINGRIVYIPSYNGNGSEFEKLILVTPIYSYGMPKHVFDLLPRLDHSKELTIIQNYGGMIGGADYYVYSYALQNGLNIKSIHTIKMPENYTLTFTMPKLYLKHVLKGADKRIDNVVAKVANGEYSVPNKKRTNETKYLKNKSNWHIIGERFSVTNDCVKCGKCVNICPAQNITFSEDKVTFADRCVACLGCYHRCPKKAIVYLKNKKKDRYVNPCIDENLIGKNID